MSLRTHESMEIQFSINGIHQKWPYCLPTWDQKVMSGPFSLGLRLCLKIETYKISVSDLVSILRLRKCQSRTRSQNWKLEKLSLRLGLEIETLTFTDSDSVSNLRLRKFESRTLSRNWDSEKFSLGLGLETETQKIRVSDPVSKLRLWKFQSRSRSQNAKVGLVDPCFRSTWKFDPTPIIMKFYKVKPGNSTEGVGYSNEGGEGSKQGWFSLKKTFANEFASKPLLSKPILSIISMGGGSCSIFLLCIRKSPIWR